MTLQYDQEPIAALATSQGRSAIAVIRISGLGAVGLLSPCVANLTATEPRRTHLRLFKDPANGEVIDEIVFIRFAAGHSYTGQESVELHCHGGPYIQQRLLKTLFSIGFRAAEPGEFTRRAYLGGRLDLTKAEGIRELANAASHQQWVAARFLSGGGLSSLTESLRSKVVEAMAYLEARIDFPDEGETADIRIEEVSSRVAVVRLAIEQLLATYSDGNIAANGLAVAIIGAPNAGKSTLMNFLLRKERALVSTIPGTTRDYIEEPCLLQGRLIRLLDTAGIRDSIDPIEVAGVAISKDMLHQADIVMLLVSSEATSEEIEVASDWVKEIEAERVIKVRSKIDLNPELPHDKWLAISTATGLGTETLIQTLISRVDRSVTRIESEPFVTTARHRHALEAALMGIQAFERELANRAFDECLAFELQQTAKSLRTLVGDIGSEDLLDKVFADFCIGK